MEIITLENIPSQTFGIVLNDQECRLTFYTRGDELYMDLEVDNKPEYQGVVCRDRINLTPYIYRNFKGSLYFVDLNGTSDPTYEEFNTRYILVYEE